MSLKELAAAAYAERHPDPDKNQSHSIFAGDIGDMGTNFPKPSNNAGLGDLSCPQKQKNGLGTNSKIGDKAQFELVEHHKTRMPGVYFVAEDDDGKPDPIWLCSPLHVLAETRDAHQSNWGRLLSWPDRDGHVHTWACPAETLQATDQSEFRRALARGGLVISSSSKARKLLSDYVLTATPGQKARCVDRIGWSGGRYVLGNTAFGDDDLEAERVVYQGAALSDFSVNGTLADWQRSVAAMAVGNSRITFAISCAFAGPLLNFSTEAGGGFQFVGATSRGKTSTLIAPAASVWGHPEAFAKQWRTTTNGIEALCLARNHNILILDELGQIDARDAGQAAYLIANGQGKVRMNKEASARPLTTWKTLLLSSGEIDITQHIESAGRQARGGQAARLPSIPADTGSPWFAIEELHGCTDGAEFSSKMKAATREYYGSAGTAFLEKLAADRSTLPDDVKGSVAKLVKGFGLPTGCPPEATRVAERFALATYAGELATKYGVTGWEPGAALAAAKCCFKAWLEHSGADIGHDDKALLNQVSSYLQTYGGSRFVPCDATPDELSRVHARSGFTRTENGETQYLVESGAFKSELCKGFGVKHAIAILIDRGWLLPGTERTQQKPRIAAVNKTLWVYVLTSAAIEGGDL